MDLAALYNMWSENGTIEAIWLFSVLMWPLPTTSQLPIPPPSCPVGVLVILATPVKISKMAKFS